MNAPVDMDHRALALSMPLDKFDISDPRLYYDDVWQPYFERLRREDPVHYTPESPYGPYWAVTKYRDIVQVEVNHKVFSSSDEVGGIMINDDHAADVSADNIYSEARFRDFKLEVEFNVAPKSNSGVYLRGRYEIQVVDDAGQPQNVHSQGALYGFIVPSAMVSKPAGEWQRYEITLIANRVIVILNGTKIIDNAEVPGITGGALDADEGEPGPIMLQGDHGAIQYRKVVLTPLN